MRNAEEREARLASQDLALDELNVKSGLCRRRRDLVMYRSSPIRSSWGRSTAAVTQDPPGPEQLDQAELASRFQAGETVEVVADGETYAVTPEDVEVRSTPRAGYSVARAATVAVTTELDAALEQEGHARTGAPHPAVA